jgi:hypothetical protein
MFTRSSSGPLARFADSAGKHHQATRTTPDASALLSPLSFVFSWQVKSIVDSGAGAAAGQMLPDSTPLPHRQLRRAARGELGAAVVSHGGEGCIGGARR